MPLDTAFDLGPIDQVSYVVADLDRALPRYEALFGPFRVAEAALPECTIRGRKADCRLRIAVNQRGPVEIELIQVLEGDTTHSEHLQRYGEGLHHVRFRVQDLESRLRELESQGLTTVFYKRFGPGAAFAYLETPAETGASVIELLELGS